MKYICEHSIPIANSEERIYTLSSEDKADYIAKKMNDAGLHVEFISNSRTKLKRGYLKSRVDKLDSGRTIVSGATFGCKKKLGLLVQRIHSLIWLTLYLVSNCKKNETVIFYHSVFTSVPMIICKRIKHIKIILEIEEIFADLNNNNKSWWRDKIEQRAILKADGFIFASGMLQEKCNSNKKPFAIANGKYELPRLYIEQKSIGKTILVYAGLIRSGKVAFNAARIARYLPERYEIRIIGYGSDNDIESLKCEIEEINRLSVCKVIYDGTKREEDYNRYLQECDYGLCPLTTDTVYQSGCFPSKITSYLANGLCVYTTQNEVVKNSPYKDYIWFVEDDNPEKFARRIMETNGEILNNPRDRILEMDNDFLAALVVLLEQIDKT